MAILLNEVQCTQCDDIITSKHRHDFVTCKCGAVSVDGGMSYLRRVGDFKYMYDKSIVISDENFEKLKVVVDWCAESGRNSLGYVCHIIRTLRDLDMFKYPDVIKDEDEAAIEYIVEKRIDRLDLQLTNGVLSQEEYNEEIKNIDGWAKEMWRLQNAKS